LRTEAAASLPVVLLGYVGTPDALGVGFVWSLIDVGLPDDRPNLFDLLLIGNTYLQFFNQMLSSSLAMF
jgi:hypothetical protein